MDQERSIGAHTINTRSCAGSPEGAVASASAPSRDCPCSPRTEQAPHSPAVPGPAGSAPGGTCCLLGTGDCDGAAEGLWHSRFCIPPHGSPSLAGIPWLWNSQPAAQLGQKEMGGEEREVLDGPGPDVSCWHSRCPAGIPGPCPCFSCLDAPLNEFDFAACLQLSGFGLHRAPLKTSLAVWGPRWVCAGAGREQHFPGKGKWVLGFSRPLLAPGTR